MKLPIDWLNEISGQDLDAEYVVEKLTLSGLECELSGHKKKQVIDFSLTPNRADSFSVKGILQELSAITNKSFKENNSTHCELHHKETFPIEVKSIKDCPVFMTRVIKNFNNKVQTPQWLKQRLELCGFKSINLVVDIANLVMLETGQPLHTYDLDCVSSKIIVRRAKNKETLKILDGSQQILNKDFLIIADDEKPLGIAGIMGSLESGISNSTSSILLESAYFNYETIMGKARALNLYSEASLRFERGVDPNIQRHAIDRFTQLLNELAGGDNGPINQSISNKDKPKNKTIFLRKETVKRILGIRIPNKKIKSILEQLKMETKEKDYGYEGWKVKAPSYRFDIENECDLIEEVARIYGYENIPEAKETQEISLGQEKKRIDKRNLINNLLCNLGYSEVINYSFVSPSMNASSNNSTIDAMDLKNPLSLEMSVMRNSLWPGMLSNLVYNIKRQQKNVRLFEVGKIFSSVKKSPHEITVISGLAYGNRNKEQWGKPNVLNDFFDIKGDLETLLECFNLKSKVTFKQATHKMLCPGRTASINLRNKMVGYIGEVNPEISNDLKLDFNPIVFELNHEILKLPMDVNYLPSRYFPYSRRDLSLLMDDKLEINKVLSAIESLKIKDLQEIMIFDVFKGNNIEDGRKSVSIGLIFQSKSRTLKDDEIDKHMLKINREILKKMKITVR